MPLCFVGLQYGFYLSVKLVVQLAQIYRNVLVYAAFAYAEGLRRAAHCTAGGGYVLAKLYGACVGFVLPADAASPALLVSAPCI